MLRQETASRPEVLLATAQSQPSRSGLLDQRGRRDSDVAAGPPGGGALSPAVSNQLDVMLLEKPYETSLAFGFGLFVAAL
jgi:hypothetical protein